MRTKTDLTRVRASFALAWVLLLSSCVGVRIEPEDLRMAIGVRSKKRAETASLPPIVVPPAPEEVPTNVAYQWRLTNNNFEAQHERMAFSIRHVRRSSHIALEDGRGTRVTWPVTDSDAPRIEGITLVWSDQTRVSNHPNGISFQWTAAESAGLVSLRVQDRSGFLPARTVQGDRISFGHSRDAWFANMTVEGWDAQGRRYPASFTIGDTSLEWKLDSTTQEPPRPPLQMVLLVRHVACIE